MGFWEEHHSVSTISSHHIKGTDYQCDILPLMLTLIIWLKGHLSGLSTEKLLFCPSIPPFPPPPPPTHTALAMRLGSCLLLPRLIAFRREWAPRALVTCCRLSPRLPASRHVHLGDTQTPSDLKRDLLTAGEWAAKAASGRNRTWTSCQQHAGLWASLGGVAQGQRRPEPRTPQDSACSGAQGALVLGLIHVPLVFMQTRRLCPVSRAALETL